MVELLSRVDLQRSIVRDHETIVAQVMGVVKWGAEAEINGKHSRTEKYLPIKTICDIMALNRHCDLFLYGVNYVKEDMHQSKTGADSLNHHRLQSLFAFWPSVYRRSIAIHTTVDMAPLASLSNWGEQLAFGDQLE